MSKTSCSTVFILLLAVLALGFPRVRAAAASTPSYEATIEELTPGTNDIYLLESYIYGFLPTSSETTLTASVLANYSLDKIINLSFDPSGTSSRYINGFLELRYTLKFSPAATPFIDSKIFNWSFSPNTTYENIIVACGYPSIIDATDYFTWSVNLYIFFDNFYSYDFQYYSPGSFHFDFQVELDGTAAVTDKALNISETGSALIDRIAIDSAPNYDHGYWASFINSMKAAINQATDIDTIISILQAVNSSNSSILAELQLMYASDLLIYDRLGAILQALGTIQNQTHQELSIVLTNISNNTTEINDLLGDYAIPAVDIDGIINNVNNRFDSPAIQGIDKQIGWQLWLDAMPFGVWMLILSVSLAFVSYLIYGRPK